MVQASKIGGHQADRPEARSGASNASATGEAPLRHTGIQHPPSSAGWVGELRVCDGAGDEIRTCLSTLGVGPRRPLAAVRLPRRCRVAAMKWRCSPNSIGLIDEKSRHRPYRCCQLSASRRPWRIARSRSNYYSSTSSPKLAVNPLKLCPAWTADRSAVPIPNGASGVGLGWAS